MASGDCRFAAIASVHGVCVCVVARLVTPPPPSSSEETGGGPECVPYTHTRQRETIATATLTGWRV